MSHLQCRTWQHSHITMTWPKISPKTVTQSRALFTSQIWQADLFFATHKASTVLLMDWKNSCSHVSSKTVNHADWWKRPCAAGGSEVPVWMCALQHRWAPWYRCTSAPVVPEGLWSGCASTQVLSAPWTLQVSDYDRDCGCQAATSSSSCLVLFTL